jgi:hypothetical protein
MDCKEELIQLAQQVMKMREAQAKYFEFRSKEWLSRAKEAERKVDASCKRILAGGEQTELFT